MGLLKRWIQRESDSTDELEDEPSYEAPEVDRKGRISSNDNIKFKSAGQTKVFIARPQDLKEMPRIADAMKGLMVVVLNLETADVDFARRVLDALAGVAYIIDTRVMIIAKRTYMFLPYNIGFKGSQIDELKNDSLFSCSDQYEPKE